ncbi:hypothetical protein B0H14DRAFT_3439171 [Mycena olivaceomarginata]|nr:hypothetical protein B0H14DRAFT_3439171 [Mycena olivaceomarginata]
MSFALDHHLLSLNSLSLRTRALSSTHLTSTKTDVLKLTPIGPRKTLEHALRREAELEALRERISQMNCEHADARKANEPITRQSTVGQIIQQRAPDEDTRKQLLTKRSMAGAK